MIQSDIVAVLHWWFIILIIGIVFLPLTILLFSRFFDKGYIFSKVLGITILSYLIYVLGILRLVPFTRITVILIMIITALIGYKIIPHKKYIFHSIKKHFKIFIFEEILFLSALFLWAYIHSFSPDIRGLEKYMDFGFINSILRGDFFPPKDMWFPPGYINYYYYGHYVTALLIKLSGVSPALGFNIMLSSIFALCLSQTFSIGAHLFYFVGKKMQLSKVKFKMVVAGFLTAVLTTLGGNFHIIYAFFKPYDVDNPKPIWQLAFLPETFPNSYWYPNATRYIYHTIHEFPIYSWVVADVHGHVLDIPFVLLTIALALAIFLNHEPVSDDGHIDFPSQAGWFPKHFILHPLHITLIGFLLAIMYMTNAWDGGTYLLLSSLIIIYLHWEKSSSSSQQNEFSLKKTFFAFLRLVTPIALVVGTFIIFSYPYNYFFKPFVSGVGVLCAPASLTKPVSVKDSSGTQVTQSNKIGPFIFEADHCQHSYWWELLMLYGFFYLFIIIFLIFLSKTKKILRTDIFILLLIILSTVLIILPEFFYIKDIYPAHYRANTMFKLVFQAFIMLMISSGYIITRLLQTRLRVLFFLIAIGPVILVMIYPYLAIGSYYGDMKNYKGLDGVVYLKTVYPADYAVVNWFNNNVKGQPVILEAQGDSYTDFERISANTGLPTVLGWTVHEWLWRGEYGIPAPRINEVKDLYESKDKNLTKELLKKYQVKYVVIGAMERQKYPALDENKYETLGRVVLQKDTTKIYEIN